MRNTLQASVLVVLAAMSGAACLTGRAQTPAERPALDVPDPPARVVAQVPPPEPATPTIDPVEDIPSGIKPSSPTRPNKPATSKDAPKPEVKPDPPPPTEPPATPPPAATPQIRMPETGDAGVASRQLRDLVERIRRSLGQINRARLPSLRQKAFDDAMMFVKQAEDALNAKNLVFAKELADKAERLAKELQGR